MSGGDGERAVVDGEIAIDGSMGGRAVEGSLDWWTDLLLERASFLLPNGPRARGPGLAIWLRNPQYRF